MSVEAKKLIDLTCLFRFKELMDQSVDGKLSKLKIDLVQPVSVLPAIEDAEEGVLYLVPAKVSGGYDLYAKETVDGTAKFVKNSSLIISGDLDGFLLKADAEKKYISAASVADDTITLSRPDGSTVVITVNNVAHATKADQDGTGAVITATYATKAELTAHAAVAESAYVQTGAVNQTIAGTKTFSKPIAGSVTGNAATATKLATARTIALSGAATGTATGFDGSGNITIPVTALAASAIRAQWYAAFPDGAEAHNSMWGSRDITAAFNAGTVSANIANGTFRDIFPGDYITKQVTISGTAYTVNWVVADCDYWINKGDPGNSIETHHVVIVPQQSIFAARMNSANTTEGGYAGSELYKNVIPACATGIVSAFGSDHILTFRDMITDTVDNNVVSRGYSGWAGASAPWGVWVSVQCNLMTEYMVIGAPHYSSSGFDDEITTRQMSAFRLSERLINYNRQWWWLRNVFSFALFACVNGDGLAHAYYPSAALSVRPFALLK